MIADGKVFDKYLTGETEAEVVDYLTVVNLWKHSVQKYKDNTAVVDGKSYTYKEVENLVAGFRTVLLEKQIRKGDRVGICLANGIDFIKAYLACTTLGVCALLMPAQFPDSAVSGCCLKYSLKAVITNREFKDVKPDCVTICSDDCSDTVTEADDSVGCTDCCVIMFTGGTTGKSKGAVLTHHAVVLGARNGCYGLKEFLEERYFLMLPLTHVFGLIRNCMTALMTGSSIWICHNNKDMFKEMIFFKPTVLVLVPALVEMALNLSKQFKRNMLGDSVKYIICGAAPVNPYLIMEYGKMGVSILPGYGLTESANLVSGNPEPDRYPDSVGFIYPQIEYKTVDDELYLKGPSITEYYFAEPEENKTSFEDGWFKTGDLVRFDSDGRLYITGRKKEVIVLPTGENICPAQIETKFNALECIQDSLVYEKNGNLVLEVFPRISAVEDKEDLNRIIREGFENVNGNLPSEQKISELIVRTADFARSPSMKILRNQGK